MRDNIALQLNKIPFFGKLLFNYIVKKQGGATRSKLLRKYYSAQNVDVGLYTYGGCFSDKFNTGGTVKVGRYCSIAEHVSYFGANHPFNMISQSAFFYNKALGLDVKDVERFNLTIGNDVWIGYGTIITAGCVNIGNGAVVGAGSVVTHDVPAYSVVAGNPARIIKMRFDENTINEIETSKWWEKEPQELYKYYKYMTDPLLMIKKMGLYDGE